MTKLTLIFLRDFVEKHPGSKLANLQVDKQDILLNHTGTLSKSRASEHHLRGLDFQVHVTVLPLPSLTAMGK